MEVSLVGISTFIILFLFFSNFNNIFSGIFNYITSIIKKTSLK